MSEKENRHTLSKDEKLCAEKRIETLFSKGDSFIAYPLRIVYVTHPEEVEKTTPNVSILISVSKKRFKRAVKRNRVKRLIREAYRLNKGEFADFVAQTGQSLDIAFLYLKNELPTYPEIEKAIRKTISTFNEKKQPKLENESNT